MNRCIQCYRCVRFYRNYAGGHDLNSFDIRNTVFFGRDKDGVLESEFAGNLVEVCPTGVFTDRTLRQHYTRKWDLRMAPSICGHCGVGCNITMGERYGVLRRVVNRFNSEVNGYFLCDRGRYGYEYVNSEDRVRSATLNGKAISSDEAERQLQALISGGKRLIGIGSPRASLESNFALRRLVGKDNFFAGVAPAEWPALTAMVETLQTSPARAASLQDVELSDAVLVLGEDVSNSAPRMALSLRQSARQQSFGIAEKLRIPLWMDDAVREVAQDQRSPLFLASTGATRLDEIAASLYRAAPDDIARLGFAIAHEIQSSAPEVQGLSEEVRESARAIAAVLKARKAAIGNFRNELPQRCSHSGGSECRTGFVRQRAIGRTVSHRSRMQQRWPRAHGSASAGASVLRGQGRRSRNCNRSGKRLYRGFPRSVVDDLLGSAER